MLWSDTGIFVKKWGFTKQEFEWIRQMSSWMVDGHETLDQHDSDKDTKKKHEKEKCKENENIQESGKIDKLRIGQMCQNLIDYARMDYLKKQANFRCVKLIQYVSKNVTKENMLMIAAK